MLLLTVLLSILFTIQYTTQSTRTHRKLVTRRRILSHRVSFRDIVNISHQMYTKYHWSDDRSCRVYQSTNGRLYRYQRIDGHISVKFISVWKAWSMIAYPLMSIDGRDLVSYNHSTYHIWYTPAPAAI